jgi:hypothetical protein
MPNVVKLGGPAIQVKPQLTGLKIIRLGGLPGTDGQDGSGVYSPRRLSETLATGFDGRFTLEIAPTQLNTAVYLNGLLEPNWYADGNDVVISASLEIGDTVEIRYSV